MILFNRQPPDTIAARNFLSAIARRIADYIRISIMKRRETDPISG